MPIFDPNDPQFSQSASKLSFEDMVDEMIESDMKIAEQEKLIQDNL